MGATGVVGQHFLRGLVDHPYFELVAICASDARTGQRLDSVKEHVPGGIPAEFGGMVFDPLDVEAMLSRGAHIAFSALPSDIAGDIEQRAAEKGISVFSNAGAHRMDADVPILIPEINAPQSALAITQRRLRKGFIFTNANCTTTGLAMALLPLISLGIRKMVVASYQAISGAGYPGHSAMDITANVIPYISNEEPKVRRECVKIFGDVEGDTIRPRDWEIHAHCVRVPTLVGHMISVHLDIEEKASLEQVESLIENYTPPQQVAGLPSAPSQPVLFTRDPLRPQPRLDVDAGDPERARGMAVTIGRLEAGEGVVRFLTLSNNLVRGAAGGSILNAELACREGLL